MLNTTNHQRNANKTTVSDHLTTVRMATINKSTNNKVGEDVKKREPHVPLVGMHTEAATVESRKELPPKL